METPTVGMLGTVSGVGLFITIITEVILRAANPTGPQKDRFGPLLALLVGVLLASGGAIATGTDPFAGFLVGVVAGGFSMGIHDVVTGPVQTTLVGTALPMTFILRVLRL